VTNEKIVVAANSTIPKATAAENYSSIKFHLSESIACTTMPHFKGTNLERIVNH
jgi:hypothetical protein